MPRNSTGTIAVNVDVDTYTPTSRGFSNVPRNGQYEFGPQDSTVRFRNIPANASEGFGLFLILPDNPSDGDEYEWLDADGSCSGENVVLVNIDDAGATGRTIGGVPLQGDPTTNKVYAFVQPNSGARFQFDGDANQWLLFLNPNPTIALISGIAGTVVGSGPATPDNFAGGAAETLFAFLMPNKIAAFARVYAMISGVLAAADTDLEFDISVVPNVTAFSGGSQIGQVDAPTMRVQIGSPVVVTGGTPVPWGKWKGQEATGNIGHITATLIDLVALPGPTVSNTIGTAIVVKLSTAAQAFNTISVSANCELVGP